MVRYRVPGWIATLVTTAFLITIFSLYGSSYFYRDSGSIFFRSDRAFEKSYSLQRELEAVAFLRSAKSDGIGDQQPRPDTDVVPNLCTVVMASPRGPDASFHTAELTIASALAGLTQAERQDLDLRVYLTSTNTTKPSPLHQAVGHLVNSMFTRQNLISTDEQELLRELERKGQTGHKAALDYVYALQACLNQSESPYIAILEDDILMADGWLARTRLALQEIEGRAGGRWLDLRLFNQVRSLGWGSKQIIRRNAILLITIICSIIVGSAFVSKRRSHQKSLAVPTVLVLCLVTVPASVTLFFQAGKASVLPPPHGVNEQTWGPCTQGNVFARSQVPGLIEAVRKDAPYKAHDLIILDYAALYGMARYVLTPPQVQHIGFHSVVSPSRPQDEFPWSVAFEDLKVAALANEHTEMVRKLYHVQ